MNLEATIVEVTADNISEHPQVICFINPKHEFYHKKIDWLKEQFQNGLKVRLLYLKGEKRPIGFIEEVKPILKEEKLKPSIIELTTADQAQKAPSLYGIFNLIYNGKLLADRYISTTRFLNIVKKEIKS
jgi:hypothetical protein